MDRNNITIIFFFVILINISCLEIKEAPHPYLMETNSLRQKIGLRIIDSTFIYYGHSSKSTFDKVDKVYRNSYMGLKNKYRKPKSESAFIEKFIKLDEKTGKPQYEEDRYRSGYYKYGYMEETDIFESLTFKYVFEDYKTYDFKTKDSIPIAKGWQFIYDYPIEKTGVTSNKPKSKYWVRNSKKIDERQADSILNSWELKRENY